jgi:hypothetical protein
VRFSFRTGFLLFVALAAVASASCSESAAVSDLGLTDAGGGSPLAQDARTTEHDAESPMSTMRLAHLAPELGRIDFCYQAAHSGSFVGPVLGGAAPPKTATDAAVDGEAGALGSFAPPDAALEAAADAAVDATTSSFESASYRTVSKYLNLDAAGPITIAIVEAGAKSCANALVTGTVTLDPGKLSTVALFSKPADAGAKLAIGSFTDDRATTPDEIRVRVIHAALGRTTVASSGPLGVRIVGAKATVLTDRVEPYKASTPSQAVTVDALGYVTAAPVPPPASIAIGPASTDGGADAGFEPWQSHEKDLDLRGGSLHTAFVLTGATDDGFEVVWCADTTTSGDQTTCELVR